LAFSNPTDKGVPEPHRSNEQSFIPISRLNICQFSSKMWKCKKCKN